MLVVAVEGHLSAVFAKTNLLYYGKLQVFSVVKWVDVQIIVCEEQLFCDLSGQIIRWSFEERNIR